MSNEDVIASMKQHYAAGKIGAIEASDTMLFKIRLTPEVKRLDLVNDVITILKDAIEKDKIRTLLRRRKNT